MDTINNHELLHGFLRSCYQVISSFTKKYKNRRQAFATEEKQIVQEMGNVANILSAIYLYRQNTSLDAVLGQVSTHVSDNMHDSLRVVWGYLTKMNDREIADLAIETIIDSIGISEKLSHKYP